VRSLPLLAILTLGCSGMKYDWKSASFYPERAHPKSAAPRNLVRPHCSAWRTTETNGAAVLDDLARRALEVPVSASRLNDTLEISSGSARLRITATANEMLYDCCETDEGSCRELLRVVRESDR
jgi:hypothetical protein